MKLSLEDDRTINAFLPMVVLAGLCLFMRLVLLIAAFSMGDSVTLLPPLVMVWQSFTICFAVAAFTIRPSRSHTLSYLLSAFLFFVLASTSLRQHHPVISWSTAFAIHVVDCVILLGSVVPVFTALVALFGHGKQASVERQTPVTESAESSPRTP